MLAVILSRLRQNFILQRPFWKWCSRHCCIFFRMTFCLPFQCCPLYAPVRAVQNVLFHYSILQKKFFMALAIGNFLNIRMLRWLPTYNICVLNARCHSQITSAEFHFAKTILKMMFPPLLFFLQISIFLTFLALPSVGTS